MVFFEVISLKTIRAVFYSSELFKWFSMYDTYSKNPLFIIKYW